MTSINSPKTVAVIAGTVLMITPFKDQSVKKSSVLIATDAGTQESINLPSGAIRGYSLKFGSYLSVDKTEGIIGTTQYEKDGEVLIHGCDAEGNIIREGSEGDVFFRYENITTEGMSSRLASRMLDHLAKEQVKQSMSSIFVGADSSDEEEGDF
ncbi:hypothetical protein KAU11_10535 [Candidatus Babeliales bacterium]|nr:hypothetical protein [Candidatus Babeliales bacterium]